MNPRVQKIAFKLHTWLGLHLSLLLAFLFLTGSILVIAPELRLAFRPNVWTTVSDEERVAGFGTIYDTVVASDSNPTVNVIEKRPGAWLAVKVHTRNELGENLEFWADPTSGAIVDITPPFGFRIILKGLHDNLLVGHRIAYLFVSGVAVLLLVLIVTGLISYRRFWKGFFRRPSAHSNQRGWLGGLHRLTAVWSLTMLLIIALTSFVFFLGGLGITGHTPIPALAQPRATVLPTDFGARHIDHAETAARAALRGFAPTVMVPPRKASDGVIFIGPWAGAPTLLGDARVSVDPVTMEILGAFTPYDNTGLARIKTLAYYLHFGTWGGVFAKLLWVVLGLITTGVAVIGVLTFVARQPYDAKDGKKPGSLRTVWRGLGIFRWVYAILALTIVVASFYHYGPSAKKLTTFQMQTPVEQVNIALASGVKFQTISGWEATAALPGNPASLEWFSYRQELLDRIVNDIGINRLRLEIRAGAETSGDTARRFIAGEGPYEQYQSENERIVNDSPDPFEINWNGFDFSELD